MAGMAAAGAAAGTAVFPGVGTAIGGVLGAFMDSSGGGGSASAGPQDAQSAIYGDLGQKNTGWNVNFAGVQTSSASDGGSLGDAIGLGSINPLYLMAAVVIIGLAVWKKSKSPK